MSAPIRNITAIDTNNDIEILEINKPYPIIYASLFVRGTTSTFLQVILEGVNHIVKIDMLEVNDGNIQDNLIIAINTKSEEYKLTYKGRCEEELLHIFYLELDTQNQM